MNAPKSMSAKATAAALSLFCTAVTTLAQADIVRPPKAEDPEEISFPLTLGVGVLCILVVAGINLMPSRRTHQD